MKARNDCEIACDCVKRANVVLHVRLCKEIFARKHTATHKPTSAQPPHSDFDDTHTRINRLWSPLAYGLGGNNRLWSPKGLRPSGAISMHTGTCTRLQYKSIVSAKLQDRRPSPSFTKSSLSRIGKRTTTTQYINLSLFFHDVETSWKDKIQLVMKAGGT